MHRTLTISILRLASILRLVCLPAICSLPLAVGAEVRADEIARLPDELREQALNVLRDGLEHGSLWVRVHAAEALLWHGYPRGIEPIFTGELASADAQYTIGCRRVLARAAARPGARELHVAAIREAFLDPAGPRVHAAETLAKLGAAPADIEKHLRQAAAGNQGSLVAYSRWMLAVSGKPPDVQSLAELVNSIDADTRATAAYALRHLEPLPRSVRWLLARAAGQESAASTARVYVLAARFAHAAPEQRAAARESLIAYADSSEPSERYELCSVLGQSGDMADVPLLESLIKDAELDVRVAAAHALLRIGRRVPHHIVRLDWAVIGLYAAGMLLIGWYYSRRTNTADDYLLGGRNMSAWSVGLSLFATLLSTITYLALPGEIIRHGPMLLCQLVAMPFILLVAGWLLIPFIMTFNVTSAYEILEARLGLGVRMLGSLFFLWMRLVWMAVIIYMTTSKVIVPLFGWGESATPYVCAVMGLVTVIYTSMGGLRAVVWTDVAQTFILFGGAIAALALIAYDRGGPAAWWPSEWAPHWQEPVWGYDPTARVTLFGAALSAFTWYVCTAGSDQMAVQRYLATRDARSARTVLATSLAAGVLVTLLLAALGLALLSYFTAHPYMTPDGPTVVERADQLFPKYIAFGLPPGVTGLVVAGLLAAAMSSLSSGLNSSCSVITVDFVDRFRKRRLSEADHVRLARYVSVAAGLIVVALSAFVGLVPGNLVEITHKTVNVLVAPLFGLFFMAMFVRWATSFGTLSGAACGVAVVVAINYWEQITGQPGISFLWAMPLGLVAQIAAGMVFSLLPIGGRKFLPTE